MKKSGFSKEQVYRRLLRNAADMWNIHESDMDSIDPLAKMLLGATSKEIERIGNELYSSDTRIFKRLAQFLLPDELQSAIPAHCIIQLDPVEAAEVTRYDELTFEKRWRNKSDMNKVHTAEYCFSSAGDFPVTDTHIAYRVQGNTLGTVNGMRVEESGQFDRGLPSKEIYLGFRLGDSGNGHVRIYFDWLNMNSKKRLFDQIPKIGVYDMMERAIPTVAGMESDKTEFDLRTSVQVRSKLEEKVVNYYNERFLRFEIREEISDRIPPFLGEALDESGEENPESIRWVKLVMPHEYDAQEVNDVIILDNCIPVMNRRLEKSIFRLHRELNIKRLDFDNFFLEVERAESNKGQKYNECPSLDLMEMNAGSFNIRLGGTGRLDERDGYEYLNYLLDLLRDEKQSFSAIDVTSTISDLKTIEQILQKVKKRVMENQRGSNQPYIIVKPHTDSENAHIYFWSTDGASANEIAVNSQLTCKNSGLTGSGFALMVSPSIGGRHEMDGKEMIQSYKSAVLSRGMIVTRRDIIESCRSICGTDLVKISIENGILTSHRRGSGLLKTIDVKVAFRNGLPLSEREHLCQQMQSELLASSNFAKPLRVLIQEEYGEVEKVA